MVDVQAAADGVDTLQVRVPLDVVGGLAPPDRRAGGVRSRADIDVIDRLGQGKLDFTVGSALDIFGGTGLNYEEMAAVNGAK